jgi:membrane-bound lytic murein transglycosylase A
MRSIPLLPIAVAMLAGCASDNPATVVTIGPAETPAVARAAAASSAAMPGMEAAPANAAPVTVAPRPSAAMPIAPSVASPRPSPQPGVATATGAAYAAAAPIAAATSSAAAAPTAAATSIAAATTAATAAPIIATTPPDASTPAAFSTRHAYYQATRFSDLPGWQTDDLGAAWDAFRRSCGVLGTRNGWSAPCSASRAVDARNAAAVRRFFETYFNAYQIRNVDRSTDGTLTGYYEPLLNGSQQSGGAYVYPVYGTPDDMLYLDARRVPASARGGTPAARIVGRTIVPIAAPSPPPPGANGSNGVYVLDLRDGIADIRDKKYRMRLDHGRIVPYYTRAEIERGGLKAPVLAYVDDPAMLYSMQVQGSGKIRMRDGTIRRFAYAEQNGRPFLPPVANRTGGHRLVVRGIDVDIDVTDDDPSATSAAPAPADADASDEDAPMSPLLRGFKLAAATTAAATAGGAGGASGEAPAGGAPIRHGFATSDPSYVFFRPIPDSPNGPVGALGVPLSAGRSIAVDPRTTPLGAPVFVATGGDPQTPGAIDRLMMAQDSGGAIRGAVRADYFYGFGQAAQTEASRTKQRLQMWVLLPKGLPIAAQDAALKTRGVGGPAASTADCVVSDPDFCVDDAP